MNSNIPESSNEVTLLIFKDNYAARVFQIPLKWISRLGLLISLFAAVTLGSLFIGIKYYRLSIQTDPIHVQDLEHEVNDLKLSLKEMESKNNQIHTVSANHRLPAPLHSNSSASSPSTPHLSSSMNPAQPSKMISSGRERTLFPRTQSQTELPDKSSLSFSLLTPTFKWEGKNLKVRSAIQYSKEDGGNTQGKILVMARGPQSLFTYPKGTLNQSSSEHLIDPDQGEYFSVSRYREIKAVFGPVLNREDLQEVEFYIFDKEGNMVLNQSAKVSQP